jgi:type VI secretion system protein ImpF
MARSSSNSAANVTLSTLDRLIDTEPGIPMEAAPTRSQSVRQLKDAVRRDLEWLLNTRRIAVPPDESLKELNRSLYVYGLPDFTAYRLSSPRDQARLIRYLQSTVKLFEPRMANVRVQPLESGTPYRSMLRFRIEGLLQMEPVPEQVSFDTVLELTNGGYEVRNAG